ncbi:hypothetical protein [Chelativorans oligotrophicus]|uniref:hypothetical protein n=1 Tax=Chelativorans oligotrophicus TaxID=449974 RepID=UPI00003A2FD4|nr:hypothetical protein [Chelativorans oligotrophicus]
MSIYDEIEERWCAIYADMHRDPLPRDGFNELLLEAETLARAATTTAFQPHLAIFEFGLEFLSYVHIALSSADEPGPSNEHTRAAWALTGAAVSFGVSIRSLVISGLDTPARALLRTYVETLFLCIAVLHDRALGEAYVAADSDPRIKDFWHSTASPKRLHERIIAIEKKIGLDKDLVDMMTTWRREEYEILSQSSHLSYLAAVLTALSHKLDDEKVVAPALFGVASAHSPRTIFYAAATTWYFSRLSNPVLLGKREGECAIVLDKENEWHQRMVAARDTLSNVMLKHWAA